MEFRRLLGILSLSALLSCGGTGSIGTGVNPPPPPPPPASPIVVATGDLLVARRNHTATLLPSGKVLILGGVTDEYPTGAVLDSAEVYDPLRGRFQSAGRMKAPRVNHSATLLPSGKVLIAGGDWNALPSNPSAELYDPVTGDFSPTGPMVVARSFHTAVPLPNGRVIIAGGGEVDGFVLTGGQTKGVIVILWDLAEVYDPNDNSFRVTSGPPGRFWMRGMGSTLPGGRALFMGGHISYSDITSSADIYSPENDKFRRISPMMAGRTLSSAIPLPSGQILVIGGMSPYPFAEGIWYLPSTELFDPTSETFTMGPSLPSNWQDLPVAVLDNDGGVFITEYPSVGASSRSNIAYLYQSSIREIYPASRGKRSHTVTYLTNGKALIAGGAESMLSGSKGTSTAELYDLTRIK